ncbi:MAG: hypothetical protein LUD76_10615 [Alistipes sp.]|nr:hypothetical protein [Alistipes sp.]
MESNSKKHRTRVAVKDSAGGVEAAPDHLRSAAPRSLGVAALRRRFGFK